MNREARLLRCSKLSCYTEFNRMVQAISRSRGIYDFSAMPGTRQMQGTSAEYNFYLTLAMMLRQVNSNTDPTLQKRELQKVYEWFSLNKPLIKTRTKQSCLKPKLSLSSPPKTEFLTITSPNPFRELERPQTAPPSVYRLQSPQNPSTSVNDGDKYSRPSTTFTSSYISRSLSRNLDMVGQHFDQLSFIGPNVSKTMERPSTADPPRISNNSTATKLSSPSRDASLSVHAYPSDDFLANYTPPGQIGTRPATVGSVNFGAVFSLAPSVAAQMTLDREMPKDNELRVLRRVLSAQNTHQMSEVRNRQHSNTPTEDLRQSPIPGLSKQQQPHIFAFPRRDIPDPGRVESKARNNEKYLVDKIDEEEPEMPNPSAVSKETPISNGQDKLTHPQTSLAEHTTQQGSQDDHVLVPRIETMQQVKGTSHLFTRVNLPNSKCHQTQVQASQSAGTSGTVSDIDDSVGKSLQIEGQAIQFVHQQDRTSCKESEILTMVLEQQEQMVEKDTTFLTNTASSTSLEHNSTEVSYGRRKVPDREGSAHLQQSSVSVGNESPKSNEHAHGYAGVGSGVGVEQTCDHEPGSAVPSLQDLYKQQVHCIEPKKMLAQSGIVENNTAVAGDNVQMKSNQLAKECNNQLENKPSDLNMYSDHGEKRVTGKLEIESQSETKTISESLVEMPVMANSIIIKTASPSPVVSPHHGNGRVSPGYGKLGTHSGNTSSKKLPSVISIAFPPEQKLKQTGNSYSFGSNAKRHKSPAIIAGFRKNRYQRPRTVPIN